MGTVDVNKLVEALLRELEAVASNDERDAHDLQNNAILPMRHN